MIIVRLSGGLGNQMFQYAMTRVLSHRHSSCLCIDTSLCIESERLNSSGLFLRPFALDVFNIQGQIIESQSSYRILKIRKQDRFKKTAAFLFCAIANKFSDSWQVGIYERKNISFDNSLLKLPSNVLLQGYFPSYKYFIDSEELIREEFTFNVDPSHQNQKTIEMLSSSNSVSIHVRRGDYISNEKTRDKFGVCSLEYYKRSIDYIAKNVEDPRFFIFSDDSDYVESNLEINYPTVLVTDNSGAKSYEDMRLMSLCKHNIIANSSFSWWGAWLNNNPNKIVIAPTPPFDKLDISENDYYPEDWVKLPKNAEDVG